MKTNWNYNLACVVLRLTLAVIFISHGYLKLAITDGRTWASYLHPNVATLIAWAEVVGGVALAVGLLSRVAAVGLGIIQIGAITLVTGRSDFIRDLVSPDATKPGLTFTRVGYEYNFALIGMCLAVVLLGSGLFSLDHLIRTRLSASREGAVPSEPTTTSEPVGTGS